MRDIIRVFSDTFVTPEYRSATEAKLVKGAYGAFSSYKDNSLGYIENSSLNGDCGSR